MNDFPLQGKWNQEIFKNDKKIVVELGCGKGEYVIALSESEPQNNYIGIDIKGARLWRGAKTVHEKSLDNVAFIRTQIELLEYAFAPGEVSEIWITFPDPQIKYKRAKHRLSHPSFLEKYKKILKPDGIIHFKTDSEFLHGYTLGLLANIPSTIHFSNHDIYHPSNMEVPKVATSTQTFYEQQYLNEGKKITYIQFSLEH